MSGTLRERTFATRSVDHRQRVARRQKPSHFDVQELVKYNDPVRKGQAASRTKQYVSAALASLLVAGAVAGTTTAVASTPPPAQISIASAPSSPATQLSGTAFNYVLNVACQVTAGSSCGPQSTIAVPLSSSTAPAMNTWAYAATSPTPGLVVGSPHVVADGNGGSNLSIALTRTFQ